MAALSGGDVWQGAYHGAFFGGLTGGLSAAAMHGAQRIEQWSLSAFICVNPPQGKAWRVTVESVLLCVLGVLAVRIEVKSEWSKVKVDRR